MFEESYYCLYLKNTKNLDEAESFPNWALGKKGVSLFVGIFSTDLVARDVASVINCAIEENDLKKITFVYIRKATKSEIADIIAKDLIKYLIPKYFDSSESSEIYDDTYEQSMKKLKFIKDDCFYPESFINCSQDDPKLNRVVPLHDLHTLLFH